MGRSRAAVFPSPRRHRARRSSGVRSSDLAWVGDLLKLWRNRPDFGQLHRRVGEVTGNRVDLRFAARVAH